MRAPGNGSGGQEAWPATLLPVGDLRPYPGNPRRNEGAIEKVSASIREFGFRSPIVADENLVVIAGHTRLQAALKLGLASVPVHVARGLSPAQVRAYRLADNRAGQESEWDLDLLRQEVEALLGEGFDVGIAGFDPDELDELLADGSALKPGADVDAVPPKPAKPVTRAGDLIALGSHRLLCGDSRDPASTARLLDGARAAAVWTDPPYGVSYVGKTKDALEIQNDGAAGLPKLLEDVFRAITPVVAPGAPFYCAHPAGPLFLEFGAAVAAAGWHVHQTLVWVKDSMVLGHSDHHYRHEPILYGWLPGTGRSGRGKHAGTRWFGGNAVTSVFEVPRPKASPDHPTGKPVELVAQQLANSTEADDIVLDPFGGSGTTLMACERLVRRCYTVELDPGFCDVIVARWEQATGQTAERP